MSSLPADSLWRSALLGGLLAGGLSAAVLFWRGRAEAGSGAAPINAVSHWLWPVEALHQDRATWKHTGTGALVHAASSLMWSSLYALGRHQRKEPTPANAVADAAALSAVAAWVDLGVVPERLTPGFEHRLRPSGLLLVYGAFALGLAVAGVMEGRAHAATST